MSVLTKVFVILVNVFSVALVALMMAYVANTDNLKQQVGDLKAARDGAEARARSAEVDRSASEQAKMELVKKYTDEINAKIAAAKAAEEQLAVANSDLLAVKRDISKLEAQVLGLSSALNQNQTILDSALKELAARREEAVKQETRAIQLADRNNELQNQIEAYNRQVNRLQEQMVQADEERAKVEDLWKKVPQETRDRITGAQLAGMEEPVQSSVPVYGSITRIEQTGGQTFAQINLGKTDKIAPNMKFIVHRDSKFVANLIILTVSDREAVGRVELAQTSIAAGDKVQSGTF